ncbi:sialate O-acetylesterase [Limosilactobacillus walteri]|uniref:Sialate O-acetylesterase domain-containing protein n=1 Tax=Limosilactobacillus walteri TaxID=2268022 RepID=A0ABR8P9H2_9LACO|nr:sialate O-acetylesterase [Limosilactobacillus walteri]MBD5807332.1 hypothetical protein [Limosilactobacillus walteri]
MMIKLPEIFQDGMVLQQNKPIKIWGYTDIKKPLQVQLDDLKPQSIGIFSDGDFLVELPAQQASNGSLLKFISDGKVVRTLSVKIGEVWLIAGQSNMDFNLKYDRDYQQNRQKVLSLIRKETNLSFYQVPQRVVSTDQATGGSWEPITENNAETFSAIGYYFGLKLSNVKSNIPIGLVWMSYGGTTASTWTSKQALESDPILKKTYIDSYHHILATRAPEAYEGFLKMVNAQANNPENEPFWDNVLAGKVSHDELVQAYFNHHELFVDYVLGPNSENRPHGLFDTMVSKIIGYRFRGCLWYQGESDDQHAGIYDHLLTALIKDWWNRWNDHFPFLIMQVAPFEDWFGNFNGTFYPEIRTKQSEVTDMLPGVYLTNVMDDGMKYDIHPKNKKLPAERFYKLALSKVYKSFNNGESPKVISVVLNDKKLKITFNNCKKLIKNNELSTILAIKRNGIPLEFNDIKIVDNTLQIKLPNRLTDSQYLEIDYQQQDYSHAGLFNENSIPVTPFVKYISNN